MSVFMSFWLTRAVKYKQYSETTNKDEGNEGVMKV